MLLLASAVTTYKALDALTHLMHVSLTALTSNYCCLEGWENWHVEHPGSYIYYTAFFCHTPACFLPSCQSFFYALINYFSYLALQISHGH